MWVPAGFFKPEAGDMMVRVVAMLCDWCIKVAVGSTNPVKVNSVKSSIVAAFPGRPVEASGYGVESGVPDQPWGEQQTRQGALNRARAAWAAYETEHGEAPSFACCLEGGIDEDDVAAMHPELAGEIPAEPAVTCFAWLVTSSRASR